MTPEEAGERAAREAESWIGEVVSREPRQGSMETRSWGPPGEWSATVTVLAPVMKEGHRTSWNVMAPREPGGAPQFMKPEEAVKAVRETVENAARFMLPLLRWACRAGFDPHEIADAATVREVMES